jgi:hypothetical protein
METYNEGDTVRIKATGHRGTVRSASEPARYSIGMTPTEPTAIVGVQLDGTQEVRPYRHDEIEAAEPEVERDDQDDVQPEPKS